VPWNNTDAAFAAELTESLAASGVFLSLGRFALVDPRQRRSIFAKNEDGPFAKDGDVVACCYHAVDRTGQDLNEGGPSG